MLTVDLTGTPFWFEQGPGPIAVNPSFDQVGAIQAIATDPLSTKAFIGSVNGGIWRTSDITATTPSWQPLTDQFQTLSISDIQFSPLDPTRQTLFAGTGTSSAGFGDGGAQAGILRSIDDGASWAQIGKTELGGDRVYSVVPTTLIDPGTGKQVVLVAAAGPTGGVWRSTDFGDSFTLISNNGAVGNQLPAGNATSIVADPSNASRFYAAVAGQGVFRSINGGLTWTKSDTGITGNTNGNFRTELVIHNSPGNNVIYAAVLRNDVLPAGGQQNRLFGVFRSTDQGNTWRQIQNQVQVNPGGQAGAHFALIAHPTDPNVFFIAGDNFSNPSRQRVTSNDGTPALDNWTPVIDGNANNTRPHADARHFAYDTAGNLYETDDGGIYRLKDPDNTANSRQWSPVNGDLRITEIYQLGYDSLNNTIVSGNQDNGSARQASSFSFDWNSVQGCDGGATAVDNDLVAHPGQTIQYTTAQNLTACGGFVRKTVDSTNAEVNSVSAALTIAGTGGRTLTGPGTMPVANSTPVFDNTIGFLTPFALNNVNPARIVLGTNFLYESLDRGDTFTSLGGLVNLTNNGVNDDGDGVADPDANEFAPANPVGAINPTNRPLSSPIAYGGRSGGIDNLAVLWVGAGGKLLLRTSGAGAPAVIPNYPGAAVVDVVMDPDDWHTAYLVDLNADVYRAISNNAGSTVTFTKITKNLGTFTSQLRSIEFVPGTTDVLVVGSDLGVFRMVNPGTAAVWSELGGNLPNAPVNDLQYNATDDVLVAGTYGRGAWTINSASFVLAEGGVLNVCGDEDQVNQDDTIRLVRNSANNLLLDVFINDVLSFSGPLAALQQVNIFGIGGNDNLIVDSTNGLITLATGIRYDGDGACESIFFGGEGGVSDPIYGYNRGVDRLTLVQNGGATQTSDTLSVGTLPGSGVSTIVGPAGTQQIFFEELEPIIDSVPSATLSITNLPGLSSSLLDRDNAINYTQSQVDAVLAVDATFGKVTIDNFEPIYFNQKTNLAVNAGAGDDKINLNNPSTPTALTTITVQGGDPTASDTLVVNGTAAADTTAITPSAADAGNVAITGAPVVNFTTIESLIYNGQGGSDNLTFNVPSGSNTTYNPGATPDSASLQVSSLVPMSFTNLGNAGQEVTLNPAGGSSFTYNGTPNNDTFTVNGGSPATGGRYTLNSQLPLRTNFLEFDITLNGGLGDDTFNVDASGPLLYVSMNLVGGDPSASDIVNLSNPTGNVAVTLGNSAGANLTGVSGYGNGQIILSGDEVANLGVNNSDLNVTGTSLDDQITYRPTGTSAGTFTNAGLNTTFNFSALSGTFTIAGGTADVADEVIIQGTNGRDTIRVDQAARTAQVNTFKAVTLAANIELVSALGLLGQDTFQVVPGVGIGGIDNLIVNVDGGGGAANDALVVQSAAGTALAANQFAVVKRNADLTSGTVRIFTAAVQWPDINYSHINTVSPNVALTGINPNLLILGPDENDPNEFLATATFLGSGSTLQIQHASIFPNVNENPGLPADQDFYRVVAQSTGTLDFQVYFRLFAAALLPQGGALNIQVFDQLGNVVGSAVAGTLTFGALIASPGNAVTGDAGARVRIPAVAGQSYYLRVFGQTPNPNNLPNLVVNGYDATIINTPTPSPATLQLSRNVPAGVAGAPDTGDLPPNAVNSDSGRSQFDNVTNTSAPTIYLRLDDAVFLQDIPGNQTAGNPPIGQIPIPFNNSTTLIPTGAGYRIAVYDAGGVHNVDPNDPTFLGFAQQVTVPAGFPHLYTFTVGSQGVADSLVDGLHHLTARVQIIDPAQPTRRTGFGDRSQSVDFVVDTAPPPVFFGSPTDPTDGLDPVSDSGVVGQSATFSDRITNITVPSFFGTAEANSVIRLFIDANGNGTFEPATDLQIGETVAVPLDGTNAFPGGQWTVRSTIDLNDPVRLPLLPHDGLRRIFVTAEDLSGNVNPGAGQVIQQLTIFLDTAGPQITNVFITSDPTFNLFGLKPNDLRPTPLVNSLTLSLQDFPVEVAGFLRNAIQASNPAPGVPFTLPNPGIFKVQGDHNGVVAISQVVLINNAPVVGQPATASVQLIFAKPLPDDRFTLTVVAEGLVDPAGNALDGENNAVEPNGAPTFPTGDGQPGGDFVARFTVDSRPEIGTYAAATVFVDINGNFVYDPDARNNDITNRDLNFTLQVVSAAGTTAAGGFTVHDGLFAGNFKADARPAADGFDKLAAYGFIDGRFRWLVDTNNDGIISPALGDIFVVQPPVAGLNLSALPIAGEFNNNRADGDEVGLFDGTRFYLDTNHNHIIDPADLVVTTALRGTPVVGDFDGDGFDDFATWKDDIYYFDLSNGADKGWNGAVDTTIQFGFPGNAELPVAADMDKDGIDDIGLFVPRRSGTTVPQDAEWYFLVSNYFAPRVVGVPLPLSATLNHAFSPSPLGHDIHAQFGDEFALPIVGNFDPPVAASLTAAASDPMDVSGDKLVSALDVLMVVNDLNAKGTHSAPTNAIAGSTSLDVNRDGLISPLDVLVIVNHLNNRSVTAQSSPSGLANSQSAASGSDAADDLAFGIVASRQAVSVTAAAAPSAQAADAVFADSSDDQLDPVAILAADTALVRLPSRSRAIGPDKAAFAWDTL